VPRTFLDEPGREALRGAVRAVEERSAAEVVVLVRERSGPYLHANVLAGAIAAYLTLWFQLFSPWEYSLLLIQVAPAVLGIAAGALASWLPDVQRALTPRHVREHYVRTAARAAFHDGGIADTEGRTGVLVYVSRLERWAEVVPDRGVRAAVDGGAWTRATEAIRSAVGVREPEAAVLAAAIASLGDVLAPVLPRAADDVNELPDEVA
jgi:putative membrane protein